MADLTCTMAGVTSPNPFWLASAPPSDKEYNVVRAFEAGWGGVVWKTLGMDPPVVNAASRYGTLDVGGQKMVGFNNIELITDRPLDVNLREIERVKKNWPDRAMGVSLMAPLDEDAWSYLCKKVEETGADALELNFGCPHGMCERGMGSAIGQVPEFITQITQWCKKAASLPVFIKLTPNVTDITVASLASYQGGADGVSLINTVNSIIGLDLDQMAPEPTVDGKGTHGGFCGPAVKPIALHMVSEIARDPETPGLPISGVGGIATWRDAAEYIALGSTSVQVCTAAMHYGFKIVEDMIDGLSNWMDAKGYATLEDFRGAALPNVVSWEDLNLAYDIKARINQDLCIKCGLCHTACEDTSHQSITAAKNGQRHFEVVDSECVGCNLCMHACPVPNCITMERVDDGARHMPWSDHPANPLRVAAE